MVNKKILITGANGYIGSHVVKEALEQNLDIIANDIKNNNIDPKINYTNIDILNNSSKENLHTELFSPTHIIHLAWQDGFNRNSLIHLENLNKHYAFLKNMIDSKVESISIIGSMHELGYVKGAIDEKTPCNPLNLYGIAKNALRQSILLYAQEKSVSVKWLRAYYIYGNDEKNNSIFSKIIQAEANNQKEFPFNDGTNFYDFIHIEDLAKQIICASIQNEIDGVINICSGIPTRLKDKVEEYLKINNFKIKLKYGVYPKRKYDSPLIYGDNKKIKQILENKENEKNKNY